MHFAAQNGTSDRPGCNHFRLGLLLGVQPDTPVGSLKCEVRSRKTRRIRRRLPTPASNFNLDTLHSRCKLASFCAIVRLPGGIAKAGGLDDGLPCPSAAHWVRFARLSPAKGPLAALAAGALPKGGGQIGFVCTIRPTGSAGRPSGPPPVPSVRELASFFQGLAQVQFTITPFPQSACPSFRSEANWVRFAQSAREAAARVTSPARGHLAPDRQIGFVSQESLVAQPPPAVTCGFPSRGRLGHTLFFALLRTMGPRPPLPSNIKLHTSDSSCLYVSPYYLPCCMNLVEKMDGATLRNRCKSLP
jgi:hypothetical protein